MKGAGILFIYKPQNAPLQIYLAKRQDREKNWFKIYDDLAHTRNPVERLLKTAGKYVERNLNAGTWSIPGGMFDPGYDKSLLDCAIREAKEETISSDQRSWVDQQYEPVIEALESLRKTNVQQTRILQIHIPSMQWETYYAELAYPPDNWPVLNEEFEKGGWFSIDKLPQPMHLLMKPTLHNLRQRYEK